LGHPKSLKRNTYPMELGSVVVIDSPIGQIAVGATEHGVAEVAILEPGERRAEFQNTAKSGSHAKAGCGQLAEFFAGKRMQFDLELDLIGTDFQQSVWKAIAGLDKGKVLTYAGLAAQIHKPLAVRAVGGAVGSNPVPLIIGCHRILGSSGALTGYSGGGGLRTKRWLLDFEGITYKS
jgi:methylated-DNA-[protein]-cysteine S-methyltransferase